MNEHKREVKKNDNEREIILLGILNVENVYGNKWYNKKSEIKKEIEYKSVKLNQVFKHPSSFNEKFEFILADDYNYIKNNYIYSAILIFNPNLNKEHFNEKDECESNSISERNINKNACIKTENIKINGNESTVGNKKESEKDSQIEKVKNLEVKREHVSYDSQLNYSTNVYDNAKHNVEKKKEGIGVLVITCKKLENVKMKHILIKMLKKEIKVESTVLKCKDKISNFSKSKTLNTPKNKFTEIKYLDEPNETINLNKPFDVKKNNFFNMTAYIYGSSNILANTSLVQREYRDDEWAEKLRKTKKEKDELKKTVNYHNKDSVKENGLIKTFTSLFKK